MVSVAGNLGATRQFLSVLDDYCLLPVPARRARLRSLLSSYVSESQKSLVFMRVVTEVTSPQGTGYRLQGRELLTVDRHRFQISANQR